MSSILGISAYYHDSAAALVTDGKLVKAVQQERFSRVKNDALFPADAITFCLKDVDRSDIESIVFYEKPLLKFERLLETYMAFAPRGFMQFQRAMPAWMKEKLFLKQVLKRQLAELLSVKQQDIPPLKFAQHHESHAASAFYVSPFQFAAVLCLDGVGEWATASAWLGADADLQPLWQINFPHSIGLLYTAFTYYCGFEVNSGEYKLMGLAPFGEPRFAELIKQHLIDIKADGTFRLNLQYFDYCTGMRMTNRRFDLLLGAPAREPESDMSQFYMDVAASIQVVLDEVVDRLVVTLKKETGTENLCLAGGVALNCVSNGKLRRKNHFDNLWIQPASGDAGGAVGAALRQWFLDHPSRETVADSDGMSFGYLGPAYTEHRILTCLENTGLMYEQHAESDLILRVSKLLAGGNAIGWYQGASEFGPRALGHRSILGDARDPDMQRRLNLKVKNRESFRPFAPIVRAEDVAEYFDGIGLSYYMSFVEPLRESLRMNPKTARKGLDRVNDIRSEIPAVTHLDYSARLQTITEIQNPRLHQLLSEFRKLTGCSVLVNTSFNERDEPIVETPEDALRCFMATDLDYLVLDQYLVAKP